jgi:hypothetical protein
VESENGSRNCKGQTMTNFLQVFEDMYTGPCSSKFHVSPAIRYGRRSSAS